MTRTTVCAMEDIVRKKVGLMVQIWLNVRTNLKSEGRKT